MEANLLWWAICAIIASLVGAKKGRPVLGFFLGLLCGPIGILTTLLIKGNRRECPRCRERIHKDAWVCPYCRGEIPAGYGELHSGSGWAMKLAVVLVALIITVGIIWSIIRLPEADSLLNIRRASTAKRQARNRITLAHFYQIRENMTYYEVKGILGSPGERVSEFIRDTYTSIVTYRWVNSDGSMVVVTFRNLLRLPDEDFGMLVDSVSNVGLTH